MADIQKQAETYYELIHKGVPPAEAFKQAFPNGMPTAQERAKEGAKGKQNAAVGQIAGTLVGALGTKAAFDYASGQPVLGGMFGKKTPDPKVEAPKVEAPAAAKLPDPAPEIKVIPAGEPPPAGTTVAAANPKTGETVVVPEGMTMAEVMPWLQGIGGGFQLINAYQQYKDGDEIGAGIGAAQGAANIAAASGSQTAAAASPWLSYAADAYGGYETLNNDNMTAEEKATRLQQQAGLAVLDAFTFGAATPTEALIRGTGFGKKWGGKLDRLDRKYNIGTKLIASLIGGKGRDQMGRDAVKDSLVERGSVTRNKVDGSPEQWNVALAGTDGGTFDIGPDGGARLQNIGENIDGEADRGYYDVDWSRGDASDLVGKIQPLAAFLTGGNKKLGSDLTGYYTNAATSAGDVNANIRGFYQQNGFNSVDEVHQALDSLKGKVSDEDIAAFKNGANNAFAGQPISQQQGSNMRVQQQGNQSPLVNALSGAWNIKPPAGGTPEQDATWMANWAANRERMNPQPQQGVFSGPVMNLPGQIPAAQEPQPLQRPTSGQIDPGRFVPNTAGQSPSMGGSLIQALRVPPPRSKTRRAGFDMNGNRIQY